MGRHLVFSFRTVTLFLTVVRQYVVIIVSSIVLCCTCLDTRCYCYTFLGQYSCIREKNEQNKKQISVHSRFIWNRLNDFTPCKCTLSRLVKKCSFVKEGKNPKALNTVFETCFLFRPDVGIGTGKQQEGRTYFLKTLIFFMEWSEAYCLFSLSCSLSLYSLPCSLSLSLTVLLYIFTYIDYIFYIFPVSLGKHIEVTLQLLTWDLTLCPRWLKLGVSCCGDTPCVFLYTFLPFISTALVSFLILCVLLLHLQHNGTSTSVPEARTVSKKKS